MYVIVSESPTVVTVRAKCIACRTEHTLNIPTAEWTRWERGAGEHIQFAMPSLSPADRELLISSICGTCFDDMLDEGDIL